MKKKNSLTLDDEFVRYCEINEITDIEGTARKIFQRGFTIEKYGETPTTARGKEIEVIKEVIKEVPVEVKGEKQIIVKEVIKEVPVEKIVINDDEVKTLKEENEKLKDELSKITLALEKMNKAKYLKGSDLNNLYDE